MKRNDFLDSREESSQFVGAQDEQREWKCENWRKNEITMYEKLSYCESVFAQIPISFKMSISDIFSITLQNTKKEKETSKQSWDMLAPFILSLNQISEEKLKHFSRYLNLPFTMGRKFPHGRSHFVSLSLH